MPPEKKKALLFLKKRSKKLLRVGSAQVEASASPLMKA
jgi:hypothetical protein